MTRLASIRDRSVELIGFAKKESATVYEFSAIVNKRRCQCLILPTQKNSLLSAA